MPSRSKPPTLGPPSDPDALPVALTFFLTQGERRAVLASLRTRSPDRSRALLRVLGLRSEPAGRELRR